MKNPFFLTIVYVFVIVIGYSQDRGYIAISAGPSFPNGDFGSKDVNNEAAGLATTGAISAITFAQKFGKTFGMTLMLRGQANPVDAQPLVDELHSYYPTLNWTSQNTNWEIGGLMGGLYGSFPLSASNKITIDTRAMVGYLSATSPEITVTASEGGNSLWVKTESAVGGTFGYLIGAGFKFGLGKHLGLLLNADYMGATNQFEDVATYNSIGFYTRDTYEQTFGTVNVGVGIGWRW